MNKHIVVIMLEQIEKVFLKLLKATKPQQYEYKIQIMADEIRNFTWEMEQPQQDDYDVNFTDFLNPN